MLSPTMDMMLRQAETWGVGITRDRVLSHLGLSEAEGDAVSRGYENLAFDEVSALGDPRTLTRGAVRGVVNGWRHTDEQRYELIMRFHPHHGLKDQELKVGVPGVLHHLVDDERLDADDLRQILQLASCDIPTGRRAAERYLRATGSRTRTSGLALAPEVREIFTVTLDRTDIAEVAHHGNLTPREQRHVVDVVLALEDTRRAGQLLAMMLANQCALDAGVRARLEAERGGSRPVGDAVADLVDDDLGFSLGTVAPTHAPGALAEVITTGLQTVERNAGWLQAAQSPRRSTIRTVFQPIRDHRYNGLGRRLAAAVAANPAATTRDRIRFWDMCTDHDRNRLAPQIVRCEQATGLVLPRFPSAWLALEQPEDVPPCAWRHLTDRLTAALQWCHRFGPDTLLQQMPNDVLVHLLGDRPPAWFVRVVADLLAATGDPNGALYAIVSADADHSTDTVAQVLAARTLVPTNS
jgi:hypothetical protein